MIDVRLLGIVARSYVLRRIALALLVMWAAFTAVFVILYLVPGDLVRLVASGEGGIDPTPEQLAQINQEYGFDKPFAVQYVRALGNVLTGDLGSSYQLRQPVLTLLADAFANTLQLALFAFTLSALAGLGIGAVSAYTRSRLMSRILDALPPLGASLPTFWIGVMLMRLLSFSVHLFPSAGDDGFSSLVLPGITMAVPGAAFIAQVFARSLRESYTEPYVAVAIAKGAGRRRVLFRHVARNALLPTITVMGVIVANLFAYSTIAEIIYSRNGIGFLLDRAVQSKDIPVVEGAVLVTA